MASYVNDCDGFNETNYADDGITIAISYTVWKIQDVCSSYRCFIADNFPTKSSLM